jgi:hypothetical protein
MKPRRPDYNLTFLNKRTDERGKIGVAWVNADGHINIQLNLKIVLAQCADETIALFPADLKTAADQ